MKKELLFLFIIMIASHSIRSQEFIPLWPEGRMPNSKGLELEHIEERQRITQVSRPGLYAFLPSREDNKGAAILVIPSGGYQKLTYNLGGFQVAKWFNSIGVSAFVLIYRLPNSPDLEVNYKGPVQDAQRAMKILRTRAAEWDINPAKIGVYGSSAGGHLATTLATHSTDFSLIEEDSLNNRFFIPDFMVLVSPVVSLGEFTHKGSVKNFIGEDASVEMIRKFSNQFNVDEKTPPSFLVHAQNDNAVSAMNSILFYEAMVRNNVPGSLHLFPEGGHEIGITNNSRLTDLWMDLCKEWMRESGFLEERIPKKM